jgi:phosphoglycolate phosphatase
VGDLRGRLIAFDLDGTLIDSRRDLTESANQLIEERGGVPLAEDAIGAMIGEGAALLVQRALAEAGIDDRAGALARFLEIYDTRLLNCTRPYDGIEEALRAARSCADVAVLTNKPLAPSLRILSALGLRSLVGDVIGGDGPYPRKPDPAALMALIERAGAIPPRTMLVGDSAIDCETARRASTKCCIAAYGFGYVTIRRDERCRGDWSVAHARELPAIIEQFTAQAL